MPGLSVRAKARTYLRGKSNDNGNSRSFDCGSRDEAARAFAQDDSFDLVEVFTKQKQTATADPCGDDKQKQGQERFARRLAAFDAKVDDYASEEGYEGYASGEEERVEADASGGNE